MSQLFAGRVRLSYIINTNQKFNYNVFKQMSHLNNTIQYNTAIQSKVSTTLKVYNYIVSIVEFLLIRGSTSDPVILFMFTLLVQRP